MYRRKVMLAAAALFAIGVAFAAQTTLRADWGEGVSGQQSPWAPGTNALMSAQERDVAVMPPPR